MSTWTFDYLEFVARLYLRAGPRGTAGKAFALSPAKVARLVNEARHALEPMTEGRVVVADIKAVRVFEGRLRIPIVIVPDAPEDLVLLLDEADARSLVTTAPPEERR